MANKFPLSKSLPLSSHILPYYGLVDECSFLMQSLCKKSRKLWQCNEKILINHIKSKRTLVIDCYNQEVMGLVNIKQLKYYTIETNDLEAFLISVLNKKIHESTFSNETSEVVDVSPLLNACTPKTPASGLVNLSICPDLIHLTNGKTFNLNKPRALTNYINKLEQIRLCSGDGMYQERLLLAETAEIEYIPTFTLKDNTDLAHFHSIERRTKEVDSSVTMTEADAKAHLKKPFIKYIGILRIEVNSESFLMYFFKTCDTKIKNIQVVNSAPLRKDMFMFQEEMSQVLISSVKSMSTNKALEKTCHRFVNLNSMEVQNFPAMKNLLVNTNQKLSKIAYVADTYNSTITIRNTFVGLNDESDQMIYCDSITAHFSKEDIKMSEDCTYLYIGGNMIYIDGIQYNTGAQHIQNFLNAGKDLTQGEERLVVLLENNMTSSLLNNYKTPRVLPRQSIEVKTSGKYIDIKVKKANFSVELNSNSAHALKYDRYNTEFLAFLKNFLNGRCNLSSPKLTQALELHILESVHFDIQKYTDLSEILNRVSNSSPYGLRKFGITYEDSTTFGAQSMETEYIKVDTEVLKWVKRYPKLEISVKKSKTESQIRMYHTPIMQTCYQDSLAPAAKSD